MLRTVASPGTFRCHDRRFLLTINVLRLLIRRLTPTTTCGSPSPLAPRFYASEGRKRLTSPHWQGVARAKRAQRPLLRGESSGPQITPVWPKGGLTSALPLLEKSEKSEKLKIFRQGFFCGGVRGGLAPPQDFFQDSGGRAIGKRYEI